jgi:glycosyltransferase involved in cell wall biosynthesis
MRTSKEQVYSEGHIAYVSVVHPLHDHRFLYKQCKGLADNGFDVDYYVCSSRQCTINGVHIKPLKSRRSRLRRFLCTFLLLPGLARGKYAAVDLADPELLPVGIILKLLTNTRVIFDAHEDYTSFVKLKHYLNSFLAGVFSLGMKFILYVSSLTLDGFVFADEGTAQRFEKLPPARSMVFHNFPVRSMFPDKPARWSERKYDIVFLGSMSQTSGIFVILEAIKMVRKSIPSLKCLFIGQPLDNIISEVNEYIRQNDLNECIEFTGRLPHADIPNLLQQCKVGLIGLLDMPKFHKNIATKMFEYMLSGVPVVSSDLPPERRYIVPGQHGYFVPPGDSNAMSETILKIILDAELGQRMSIACHQYMLERQYFAENEVEKLVGFYEYLLAHRRKLLCVS